MAHARTGVILLSSVVDPMPLDEFERFAEVAFADAERGNDTFVIGRMMMAVAWNYLNRGLSLEGRRWAYRLMTFGRDRQDQRSQGMALWLLGWLDVVAEDYVSALGHGEECTRIALAPLDHQMGHQVIGMSQVLLGRIEEGCQTLRRHQQVAVANEWHYSALGTEPLLGVSMLLRGDIKQGVKQLETTIHTCEIEYGYQAGGDFSRLYLAEFYIALLRRTGRMSLVRVLKSPLFILNARRVAAKRADALLTAARRNTQFSDRGVFRARIDFNLGLLHKATGRSDLARSHLSEARIVALAQEADALVAKIEAAMVSL
jgi:hypothetical protein